MKRVALMALFPIVSMLFTLGADMALADGVKGVAVKPLSPRPGEVITVKGEMLGLNSTVEVRVVGNGVDLDLGEVKADGDGDFTAEFTLPASLPPGSYGLRATGAESATTQLRVAAASGAVSPLAPGVEVPVRERPLPETAGLVALSVCWQGWGCSSPEPPGGSCVNSNENVTEGTVF